jgi:hypothetical protein
MLNKEWINLGSLLIFHFQDPEKHEWIDFSSHFLSKVAQICLAIQRWDGYFSLCWIRNESIWEVFWSFIFKTLRDLYFHFLCFTAKLLLSGICFLILWCIRNTMIIWKLKFYSNLCIANSSSFYQVIRVPHFCFNLKFVGILLIVGTVMCLLCSNFKWLDLIYGNLWVTLYHFRPCNSL